MQEILLDLTAAIKTKWPGSVLLVPLRGKYRHERYIYWFLTAPDSLEVIQLQFNINDPGFSLACVVSPDVARLKQFKQLYECKGEDPSFASYTNFRLHVKPVFKSSYFVGSIDDNGRIYKANLKINISDLIDWVDKGFV